MTPPQPLKRCPMPSVVLRALRRAGLVAVITLGLAACGHATAPPLARGTTATPSRPAPASSTSSTSTATPAAPSAAGQLAAFISAAEQAESQLRHTAALINSGISATSMRFTPATVAAVQALSNAPVARAIPAGLPTGLLRTTMVVYGDLASRRWRCGSTRSTSPTYAATSAAGMRPPSSRPSAGTPATISTPATTKGPSAASVPGRLHRRTGLGDHHLRLLISRDDCHGQIQSVHSPDYCGRPGWPGRL